MKATTDSTYNKNHLIAEPGDKKQRTCDKKAQVRNLSLLLHFVAIFVNY